MTCQHTLFWYHQCLDDVSDFDRMVLDLVPVPLQEVGVGYVKDLLLELTLLLLECEVD
jgi:hypothetical protein